MEKAIMLFILPCCSITSENAILQGILCHFTENFCEVRILRYLIIVTLNFEI